MKTVRESKLQKRVVQHGDYQTNLQSSCWHYRNISGLAASIHILVFSIDIIRTKSSPPPKQGESLTALRKDLCSCGHLSSVLVGEWFHFFGLYPLYANHQWWPICSKLKHSLLSNSPKRTSKQDSGRRQLKFLILLNPQVLDMQDKYHQLLTIEHAFNISERRWINADRTATKEVQGRHYGRPSRIEVIRRDGVIRNHHESLNIDSDTRSHQIWIHQKSSEVLQDESQFAIICRENCHRRSAIL